MKKVLCLGLTPVLQRTLVFDRLETDEVNRARQVVESAAGKALNTARALVALGTPAQTAGFNGGDTGRRVAACLAACGVDAHTLTAMKAPTRVCTTLIDRAGGTVTELVEEAPAPGIAALRRFTRDTLRRATDASMLVISGTLPPYADNAFYVPFVHAANEADVPVVIDSHRTALINVLFERPLLAKLNVRELEVTLEERLTSERRILRGMRDVLALGARNVFVTQGGKGAYLLTPRGVSRYAPLPPCVTKTLRAPSASTSRMPRKIRRSDVSRSSSVTSSSRTLSLASSGRSNSTLMSAVRCESITTGTSASFAACTNGT
ncbi:MAG TPA: PfkB family carbohydrate kinase [Kiritimatiellia bacterium]|nr:PfkB family carbohydrate kinase [Kiritimatiellia bacterium]